MMTENFRRSCRRRLVMASGALALVAAITCAADAPRDVVVLWSANDQWVKIEPQDDAAAPPNDHPAQLTSAAVGNALAALRTRIVDEDTAAEAQRPVFTAAELRDLAPRIASGLAKAGPRQDVTFSTIGSHPRAAGGLVKDLGVNAGRVFYDDGRINVIFGELQSGYRKRNVYGQRTEDFTARQEGSRSKAAERELALAARPGVELHSDAGGVRNDWVEIDSAAVVSGAAAVTQNPAPAAAKAPPATAAAPVATAAAPVATAAAPVATATASGQGPVAAKSGADLEQRLKTLKDLRDKNLISEEAYRAKMQELLSEL
jgi:hypothetical protein